MNQIMVQYKVKPEYAARNEELVRQVYDEMSRTAPEGIRYATFVLEDGVSFVHLASIETKDETNPLMENAAFRAFQENIGDRCVDPPRPATLRMIGSFGVFGARE